MIKVSALYPNGKNAKFDMEYRSNTHMPLVRRILGSALRGVSVDEGLSGEEPGSAPPYIAEGTCCSILSRVFNQASAVTRNGWLKTSPITRISSPQFKSVK